VSVECRVENIRAIMCEVVGRGSSSLRISNDKVSSTTCTVETGVLRNVVQHYALSGATRSISRSVLACLEHLEISTRD
jgi:hypothetical protein